jgi:hypothetical protein
VFWGERSECHNRTKNINNQGDTIGLRVLNKFVINS